MVKAKGNIRNLESFIKDGEKDGTGGFVSQTVNGSGRYIGTGWDKDWDWGTSPEVEPGGAWQPGRSNRGNE